MKPAAGTLAALLTLFVAANCPLTFADRTETMHVASRAKVESASGRSWRPKPAPPIAISYEIIGEPQVGRAVDIELRVHAGAPMTNVTIALYGDERVTMSAPTPSRSIARLPRDEAVTRRLFLTPHVGGALEVNVVVEADIAGTRWARILAIPLQIGPGARRSGALGALLTSESGELLLSLPASDRP